MFASMVSDFSNKENECSSAHPLCKHFAVTVGVATKELADCQD
jgi:hypothetical protein